MCMHIQPIPVRTYFEIFCVFTCVQERENWIVLACAFWYKYVETRNIESYKIVVNILEKELTLNRINKRAVDWSQAFLKHVKSHCPS